MSKRNQQATQMHTVGREFRRWIRIAVWLLIFPATLAAQQTDIGWPRTVQTDGQQVQIYQPQVDSWQNGKLNARAAMVITRKDLQQPIYGVIWFSARTTLDQDARLVILYDISVNKTAFPAARSEESSYASSAVSAMSNWTMTIALDRLLADLAITQTKQKARPAALSANPPQIYVRQNPASLILVDGQPVMQEVPGTNLMRVINSPAVIVLDAGAGQYFLQGDNYWMTAPSLAGPWTLATKTPASLQTVLNNEVQEAPPSTQPGGATSSVPPEVIVSTEPAELVQLQGEPLYAPINGTKLLYVTNTDDDLFLTVQEQRYYVLLSGRWFSAKTLDGPWEFVPGADLPKDFSCIPEDHPKADVLASVPGTPEARDAIVAAQVPQTATVDRKTASFTATYDGEPQFKAIKGTDMSYAINSSDDIISVGGRYYAVSDGVWFVADDPNGPWAVCDNVPSDIYSIPPTAPVYPATYVYVYDSTPDFVYVGYTPGYFGAYIWDGVVVYGTGFWYPCWAVDWWCGWPWTWGFGWHYAYWGAGFFWRPWYHNRWYWHRWNGKPGFAEWNRRVLYNRSIERTGARSTLANRSVYDRWNSSAVISRHPVSLRPGAPRGAPPAQFHPPAKGAPDLYGGRDGQVYRHEQDGWYRFDGQKWQQFGTREQPSHPSAQPNQQQPNAPAQNRNLQDLDRERQARTQGTYRANQPHAPSAPPRSAPIGRPLGGGHPGGGRR
jgi:hypothetical protein